jgi:NDP-sugar pyrophosphorylase family protein
MDKDKSIIMVGGPGARLWPLTETRPKPNVYMGGNKRILEYIIDGLVEAGFYDIHMATQYRSDDIRRCFGDGSAFAYSGELLKIIYTYAINGEMRGTADSIRQSRMWLSDVRVKEKRTGIETAFSGEEKQRFIEDRLTKQPQHWEVLSYDDNFDNLTVSSGDSLTNLDHKKMMEFHKKKGAFATVALVKVPLRRLEELGSVSMNEQDIITKFYEKENPKKLPEDIQKRPLGNTGIYIFNNKIFDMLSKMENLLDWGHDFFHKLASLAEEFPQYRTELSQIYGFVDDNPDFFWDDIGTIASYKDANMRLIDGIPRITTFSRKVTGQESNTIRGIAKHSLLGRGCEVYGTVEDCVLGNDVYVGKGTHLKRCILNSEARVGDNLEGDGWIVDRIAKVEEGAQVGKDVVIGRGSTILPGAKVKDNTRISAGMNIDEEVEGKVSI